MSYDNKFTSSSKTVLFSYIRFITLEGEPVGNMQEAHENGGKDKKRSLMEDAELDDWNLHQIRKQYPIYFLMLCEWMNQSPHILLQIMSQGFYLSMPLRSWVTMYWPLTESCHLFFNTASIHLSNHLSPYECYTLHAASPSFFVILAIHTPQKNFLSSSMSLYSLSCTEKSLDTSADVLRYKEKHKNIRLFQRETR